MEILIIKTSSSHEYQENFLITNNSFHHFFVNKQHSIHVWTTNSLCFLPPKSWRFCAWTTEFFIFRLICCWPFCTITSLPFRQPFLPKSYLANIRNIFPFTVLHRNPWCPIDQLLNFQYLWLQTLLLLSSHSCLKHFCFRTTANHLPSITQTTLTIIFWSTHVLFLNNISYPARCFFPLVLFSSNVILYINHSYSVNTSHPSINIFIFLYLIKKFTPEHETNSHIKMKSFPD